MEELLTTNWVCVLFHWRHQAQDKCGEDSLWESRVQKEVGAARKTMLHALCSYCLQLKLRPPGLPLPFGPRGSQSLSSEPQGETEAQDWQKESGTPLDSYQFLYRATELFVCYIAGVQGSG